MKEFKEFLAEARAVFDPTKYLPRQKKEVELYLGRFQPVHLGHIAIIKGMKNPVVALVKGAKSSEDKSKNPLDEKLQMKYLKKVFPKLDVVVVGTGYIPDIINEIRKTGKEPSAIYAGADRFKGYSGMIDSYNSRVDDDQKITVKMKETPRVTSATIVRNAVKDGDEETFLETMPKELHGEWDNLRKIII